MRGLPPGARTSAQRVGGVELLELAERPPFWQTKIGRFFRWLVFLPLCFTLTAILQVIPPWIGRLIENYPRRDLNLLTIMFAGFVASFLLGVAYWWLIGLIMSIRLCCYQIAPNNKVASVIFGSLFCVFQWSFLASYRGTNMPWLFWVYQTVFSILVIVGTVLTYKE